MDTPSGNGAKSVKDIDLDISAFVPEPVSYIVVNEQRYGVLGLIDVPAEEALEALKLDLDISKQEFSEQVIRTRRQVQILLPSMPIDVLNKLSMRQLIRIAAQATQAATGEADPPPAADAAPSSASASPSPAIAASTEAATATP